MDESSQHLVNAILSFAELDNEYRTRYRTMLAAMNVYLKEHKTSLKQLANGMAWLEFREAFEPEIDTDGSILELLHYCGIRLRDVEPRCDVRPLTERQRHALRKLDVHYNDETTYSEAKCLIRKAQHEPGISKRQCKPRPRAKVSVKR